MGQRLFDEMANERCFNVIVTLLSVATITLRHAKTCRGSKNTTEVNITTFVLSGSSAELSCFVRNVELASWVLVQKQTPSYISLGKKVLGSKQNDYVLRVFTETNQTSVQVNSSEYVYNLTINNVTEDMEGTYSCKQEGRNIVNIVLSAEVPPLLWLQADNSNISSTTINVTQNEEISITCKAVGGKPEVYLFWRVNGQNQTHGVTTDTFPDGIFSILQYRPNVNDKNITCETSGQTAVPSLETFVNVNVLYGPTCHILLHEESISLYRVTCICVANPQVSRWSIFVNNDSPIKGDTALLPVEVAANIYCMAENAVGFYETPFKKYYPTVTPAVTTETNTKPTPEQHNSTTSVTIIVATVGTTLGAVVMIAALIFIKRIILNSRNESNSTDTSAHHYYHLPFETRGVSAESDVKYSTYLHQEPNVKHEYFEKQTNIPLDEAGVNQKPEYLEIIE
ncbi:hypothetical protein HOLleu_34414 [Holothuria leucospilota]|uniref:Ig-like domain-containing protein n=1 Tax=Holothuria leucospilota TaxID=206669 RepID=A0A9Q0YQI3_HOLLE|nr:hypothetical protein HOLleu_34414 [Holothuria leucospilota]